jgi:hypothetical protein
MTSRTRKNPLHVLPGLLLLMLGGIVLFYTGSLSTLMRPSSLETLHPQASMTAGLYLLMSPVLGWFVVGMGAVFTGLKLQENRMV